VEGTRKDVPSPRTWFSISVPLGKTISPGVATRKLPRPPSRRRFQLPGPPPRKEPIRHRKNDGRANFAEGLEQGAQAFSGTKRPRTFPMEGIPCGDPSCRAGAITLGLKQNLSGGIVPGRHKILDTRSDGRGARLDHGPSPHKMRNGHDARGTDAGTVIFRNGEKKNFGKGEAAIPPGGTTTRKQLQVCARARP